MWDKPETEAWRLLQPGQTLVLEVEVPLFSGHYMAEVIQLGQTDIRVSVPVEQGKLVLLPVGTPLVAHICQDDKTYTFNAWVSERHAGHDRYMVLSTKQPKKRAEEEVRPSPHIPVWAVTSGKGGVGKTTTVVNLALALIEQGRRVCVIDGDLGTANVDIVLNLAPRYTLSDVVNGQKHVLQTLVEGPKGMVVLPGGSGLQELTQLCDADFEHLLQQFKELEQYTDVILIDTSSGLSRNVTNFIVAADMGVLVTTPEPPAITDAYALIKVLARAGQRVPMRLVVNKARSAAEAKNITDKMVFAARRFLNYELQPLGYISADEMVERAVRAQVAVLEGYPKSRVAMDFREVAQALYKGETAVQHDESRVGAHAFLQRFRSLLQGKDRIDAAS